MTNKFEMLQKMSDIKSGYLRPPKEELEEMMKHFIEEEIYDYCAYLKQMLE